MHADSTESAKITIRLKDQTLIEGFRLFATGVPAIPLTDKELAGKFRACANFAGVLNGSANDAIERIFCSELTTSGHGMTQVLRSLWADTNERKE